MQIPKCPKCSSIMVQRMAGKGSHTGKIIYGCSKYPLCKSMVNIPENEQPPTSDPKIEKPYIEPYNSTNEHTTPGTRLTEKHIYVLSKLREQLLNLSTNNRSVRQNHIYETWAFDLHSIISIYGSSYVYDIIESALQHKWYHQIKRTFFALGGLVSRISFFLLPFFIIFNSSLYASVKSQNITLLDSLLSQVPTDFSTKRMAVLPFSNSKDPTGQEGASIAEYLITLLQQRKACTLIDRINFQKAIQEIKLSLTGMVSDSSALEVGKFLSADYLLIGSISQVFGNSQITAKIIRTETSEIISSAMVSLEPGELDSFSKEMYGEAGNISSSLFRSILLPGWGQFYTHHPIRGSAAISICLSSLCYTGITIYQDSKSWSDYNNYHNYLYTPEMIADRNRQVLKSGKTVSQVNAEFEQKDTILFKEYSSKHNRMVVMSVITGSLWAANIVDALFAGIQNKRKFDLYFSGTPCSATAALSIYF